MDALLIIVAVVTVIAVGIGVRVLLESLKKKPLWVNTGEERWVPTEHVGPLMREEKLQHLWHCIETGEWEYRDHPARFTRVVHIETGELV